MHQYDPSIAMTHPCHGRLTPVRPAIVYNEKQSFCVAVRLMRQYLIHESAKRLDPRFRLASAHDQSQREPAPTSAGTILRRGKPAY